MYSELTFWFSKITPLIAKLQQECWDGYVSTGRGCQTLFQLIDTDSSGTITWAEIRFFLENVRQVQLMLFYPCNFYWIQDSLH